MIRPTLSVVIPNYNHARFLPETLHAIMDQSYRPQEVIVIDDGSTDNSIEVIESFAQRAPIIRLFRNDRNRGVNFSTNRGVELASGEYVYCPSADDTVLPGLFEKSMNLLAQHPQAGLCSAFSGVMSEKGEYRGLLHTPIISGAECFLPPEKALAMLLRHGTWFKGTTAVYRRRALIEAGGFLSELGPYSDGFINLVLALKYGACFIPEPLAMWRKMRGTYSVRASANLDMMLDIMHTAMVLMRSTYRDVFPPAYVDDWERRWLFDMGTGFIASSQGTQTAGLERLLQPPNPVERALFAALRLSMAAEYLVTKLCLFARFRRAHLWQELARKLRHLSDPRITRSAKGKRPSGQIGIKKKWTSFFKRPGKEI